MEGSWGRRSGELKGSYDVEEFGEGSHVHLREVVAFEFAEVAVVAHDIGGSSGDSTINKLIVVRVDCDEVEAVSRADVLDIGCICDSVNDKCSEIPVASHVHEDLLVFKENIRTDAQRIAPCAECLPDVVPERAGDEYWDEAVCVKDYLHL